MRKSIDKKTRTIYLSKIISDQIGYSIYDAIKEYNFFSDNGKIKNIPEYISTRLWGDIESGDVFIVDVVIEHANNYDMLDLLNEEEIKVYSCLFSFAVCYLSYSVRANKVMKNKTIIDRIIYKIKNRSHIFYELCKYVSKHYYEIMYDLHNYALKYKMIKRQIHYNNHQKDKDSLTFFINLLVNKIEEIEKIREKVFSILSPE